MPKPHHQLLVWKRSITFVELICQVTATFPNEERFGLVSQMRRAAVSVPSNIAEGAARNTAKEFNNFLCIAQGSTAELETQIMISCRLEMLVVRQAYALLRELDEISRMIVGLQRSLKLRT